MLVALVRRAQRWLLAGSAVCLAACSTVSEPQPPEPPAPVHVQVPDAMQIEREESERREAARRAAQRLAAERLAAEQAHLAAMAALEALMGHGAAAGAAAGTARPWSSNFVGPMHRPGGAVDQPDVAAPVVEMVVEAAPEPPGADKVVPEPQDYSVRASATERLSIPGPPGELRVWIGVTSRMPQAPVGMATQAKSLGTSGQTARVKPFALGLEVEPRESICARIDPSGSELRFKLLPSKTGDFSVGADVELYSSGDCTGAAIPKSAESVTVRVGVDSQRVASDSLLELLVRAWKAFLGFWEQALVIVFALLLFLLRKRLFGWFGFESKD